MFPGGFSRSSLSGPTAWLATATVGVYLLLVVGATASLADAAQACSSWPGCTGTVDDPGVLVALGHRALAALVGLVVFLAGVIVFRTDTPLRVKLTTVLVVALYPAQMIVGAVLAGSASIGFAPALHLFVGVALFGTLVAALAWQLEYETGSEDDPLSHEELEAMLETAPEPAGNAGADASPTETQPAAQSSADPLAGQSFVSRLQTKAFAYFRLTKPKLMWLLCLVAAAAMALAGGRGLSVQTIVLTLSGGVLSIGASGTFNHVLERDRDKRMERTSDRPLATYEVPKRNAIIFGFALTLLSLVVFLQVNVLAAALGLVAILFYSIIYTLVLKPNTAQNTVIGGAAGALPALIGWAAVTGRIDVAGLALAGLIFVWTPAHFYNLALAYQDDYARGGFPMMPVVRGETTTRKHVLWWLGTTLAAASVLIWLTDLGWLSAATTTVFGTVFLWAAIRLHREQTESAAFRAFHASNAYLGCVLLAVVVDALAI